MSYPPTIPPEPESSPARPRRTVGTWLILLAVWTVGLISWAVYVFVLVYLLVKIL